MNSYSRIDVSISPLRTWAVNFLLFFIASPIELKSPLYYFQQWMWNGWRVKTQAVAASKECYMLLCCKVNKWSVILNI